MLNFLQLILGVASVCKKTIVVAHLVGPVIVESWIDHPNVKAFINANLPGQESGNSIVDVLFGAVNPSGKLVYTMAKKPSDYATSVLYNGNDNPQITYDEKLLVDYRWFDAHKITPRYEFGFGLSYTTFAYSGLSIKATRQKRAGSQIAFSVPSASSALWKTAVTVSFTIENTGQIDGHEVAQLYLQMPASAKSPIRCAAYLHAPTILTLAHSQLRGFERVKLAFGQSSKVTMTLTTKDISVWDVKLQAWRVPTGTFKVFVGASSRQLSLTGTFTQ
jgi:beta-glucosidase